MSDDTRAVGPVPPTSAVRPPAQYIPAGGARRQPYSEGKRVGYGLLWAAWTLVLAIAGFSGLFSGQILGGLFALVLAALAGRYDYRIWTWRARRLLFFIIW
jgi:hypothetical protein